MYHVLKWHLSLFTKMLKSILYYNYSRSIRIPIDLCLFLRSLWFFPAQVPATLLSSPSGRYSYQGTGLVAQCIAYGSPRPEITWSAPSLQINDFDGAEAAGMPLTVVSENAIIDGLIVTYSTLHFCPSTLATLSPYVAEIQCSTTNGLANTFGQQMASFTPAPFSEFYTW